MNFRPSRYPTDINAFSDFSVFIREAFSDITHNQDKLIKKNSKILAQGSCFAGNVIDSLKKEGLAHCDHFDISENLNNTFANKAIIDIIINEKTNEENKNWLETIIRGKTLDQCHKILHDAEIVILTFGVSFVLVDHQTHEIQSKPGKGSILQQTNVSKNADNIEYIISRIKKFNPNCTIIVTVSPIPLSTTATVRNVFIDDFLSKSTIRLAVDEALNRISEKIIYWPSFEIVRWSNIHFSPSFGAPHDVSSWNGEPRHPDPKIIAETMKFFLETFSDIK
ncbi:GSCFA domain-containing protein [Nisaea denitrificans]|uniref:GSCFA domain-containing protein n=1 Tax=Nisaea denitrificans TaxID=390877 RepID=UPI00041CB2BE|nr:GSCFA domain-containing protein [Nisaea denitrificans]